MPPSAHFSPALFEFLEDLAASNSREWFEANRDRYERDAREPMIEFIADFADRLREISPRMVADPRRAGGSMFRIHRDIRFSRDKSPYKTNIGAHFRHEIGRDVHGPGLYLHLEPGMVFAAAGIWRPNSATLTKIREAIVANPAKWESIVQDAAFRELYTLEHGESLKRPPRGFDPEHPLVETLKLKTFAARAEFDMEAVCSPDFMDIYAAACRTAAPLCEFLTRAVGLDW